MKDAFNAAASTLVAAAVLLTGGAAFAAGGGGAGGGGGGGGGGKLQIATRGLFVVDQPRLGEANITGYLIAQLAGGGGTPADTVVTLNGVRLVPMPGTVAGYFIVDPAGPQPALGPDGFLHLVASSVSANNTRQLNLPCSQPVVETTDPVAGTSLQVTTQLNVSWSPAFPQNVALVTNGSFMDPPQIMLAGYDPSTGQPVGGSTNLLFLDQTLTNVTVPVTHTTAPLGYILELKYPGTYVLDGNSGGVCGRVIRKLFTN